MKSKVSLNLRTEIRDELRRIAKEEDVSMSFLVNSILADVLSGGYEVKISLDGKLGSPFLNSLSSTSFEEDEDEIGSPPVAEKEEESIYGQKMISANSKSPGILKTGAEMSAKEQDEDDSIPSDDDKDYPY